MEENRRSAETGRCKPTSVLTLIAAGDASLGPWHPHTLELPTTRRRNMRPPESPVAVEVEEMRVQDKAEDIYRK